MSRRGSRAPTWGIVLAAGSGARFGSPKQFAEVGGRRCVDMAVDAIGPWCAGVVVTVPAGTTLGRGDVIAVAGGPSRSASVRAALEAVPAEADIVVVHDAAHPLAAPALFELVIAAVEAGADAALPIIRPAEAVKRLADGRVSGTVPRESVGLAQMPHAFRAHLLRSVHASGEDAVEDSELVERVGGAVQWVPGDVRNLHVTTPGDLELVRALLLGG